MTALQVLQVLRLVEPEDMLSHPVFGVSVLFIYLEHSPARLLVVTNPEHPSVGVALLPHPCQHVRK